MRVLLAAGFRMRCHGRDHVPPSGGVLILSNHQSHLDPMIIGAACERQVIFLARQTLFRVALLGWLLRSLKTIPIDREGSGLGGLKETLRRLKRGEMVAMFPEGTRSRDGQVGRLKPGFCSLARRARVPLVPVAIDGAFDAWPRSRRLPRPHPIAVRFGEPIELAEIAELDDDGLMALIARRIGQCHAALQAPPMA